MKLYMNVDVKDISRGSQRLSTREIFQETLLMQIIQKIVDNWPGKRIGVYRFLPVFFLLGAALEFSMINWYVVEKIKIIVAQCFIKFKF